MTFCNACFSHFWQLYQELHKGDQWKAHSFYSSFEWAQNPGSWWNLKILFTPYPPGYAQRHSDIKTDLGSVSQSNTSKRNPLGKQGRPTSPSAQAVKQDRIENKCSWLEPKKPLQLIKFGDPSLIMKMQNMKSGTNLRWTTFKWKSLKFKSSSFIVNSSRIAITLNTKLHGKNWTIF